MKPYIQINFFGIIIRCFYKKENINLYYKWHCDDNNRKVLFFPFGKWKLQFNNKLPVTLTHMSKHIIPKNTYHRLIYKSGILICFIKE